MQRNQRFDQNAHGADTRRFARQYGTTPDRSHRGTAGVVHKATPQLTRADHNPGAICQTGSWAARFAFFATHGAPSSSAAAATAWFQLKDRRAYRALGVNLPALLLGPFYFFAKGMWRKGTTLLIAMLTVALAIVAVISDGFSSPGQEDALLIAFAFAVLVPGFISPIASFTASYAYYLHVTTGSRSWNPFEGLFGKLR